MAEILGIVASGISVAQIAGQVINSIIKLKGYWEQVKEVPAEISYLLGEIDSLSLLLYHIQDNQSSRVAENVPLGSTSVQQCCKLCQDAAEELRILVSDMESKLEGKIGWKRRVTSAKVVLKKEEVKGLKRRMKNAVRLLSLALSWQTK
jgi:hypothetical protein